MVDASGFPVIEGIEELKLVGQGGFAKVYSGFQSAFRRTVAVKVIQRATFDEDDQRRFDRECQAMGALSHHPNIVTLYAAGYTADGQPYMVMPFVAQGTLQDRIRREQRLSWQDTLDIGASLCGALETAHAAGVLHRDIKPANVLMADFGVQLSDFGIARIADGHETKSGVITASIAHAPPEILDGAPPSARSDVYSLGSTLYEALAGRAPFVADGDSGIGPMIRRVMFEAPPDLRGFGVPDAVAAVVERAIAKEAVDRFATAREFGDAIENARNAQGLASATMSVPPVDVTVTAAVSPAAPLGDATDRSSRGRWVAAGALSLAVICGGAFAAFVVSGSDDEGADAASVSSTADAVSTVVDSIVDEVDPAMTTIAAVPAVAPLTLPDGDPIELEFWHPGVQTGVIESAVQSFEAANPGITVSLVDQGSYSRALRAVQDAAPSDRPDVLLVADRGVQTMLDRIDHVPVGDLIARDDFDVERLVPAAVSRYSSEAGLEAMPFNTSVASAFVNLDIFRAAGIDVDVSTDTSFSALRALCDQIADRVTTCIEFNNDAFLFEQLVSRSGALMFTGQNGRAGEPDAVAFDEGAVGRDAFGFLATAVGDGMARPLTDSPLFFNGESAMIMTSSSSLGWIDRNLEERGDPFAIGAVAFPRADGTVSAGAVAGGGALWVLDSGDDRRSIASWLLLEQLVSMETQLELHQGSGYVPVLRDAADEPEFKEFWTMEPLFAVGFQDLLAADPGPDNPGAFGGRVGPFHQVDAAIMSELAAARDGSNSLDAAFDEAVVESNRLIAEYLALADGAG